MSRLGPDSRALFRGARRELAPDDADRTRVARALALKLGVAAATVSGTASSASAVAGAGAGATAAGTASAGAGASALLLATTAKWISVVVLVGAAGAIGAGAISGDGSARSNAPPAARSATTETRPRATPAPLQTAAPVAGLVVPPTVVPSARPAPRPVVRPLTRDDAPAATPTRAIADETRLLRLADEAMRRGDARAALGLLDEHAELFPAGVLSEERSAERAYVLCALGRDADARDEAARFVRTFPGSPLTDRVRATCASRGDGR